MSELVRPRDIRACLSLLVQATGRMHLIKQSTLMNFRSVTPGKKLQMKLATSYTRGILKLVQPALLSGREATRMKCFVSQWHDLEFEPQAQSTGNGRLDQHTMVAFQHNMHFHSTATGKVSLFSFGLGQKINSSQTVQIAFNLFLFQG